MLARLMPIILLLAGWIGIVGCGNESERLTDSAVERPPGAQEASDKILLVHSYHREYEWVAGISRGVKRAMETADVEVETFYMDTKRRTEADWKRESGQLALMTMETWQPDIVIAVDDNAQQYFARYLVERGNPEVIFCGVNADPGDYGYPAANVTGILERPHYTESLDLLTTIMPEIRRIAIVTDNSPTSAGALKYMREQQVAIEVVAWETPRTFREWQEQVLAAQDTADAVVTYMYHTVAQGDMEQSMAPSDVMSWTVANSRIPVVGFFSFSIDDGMLCGVVESAVEHGVEAGGMARRVLAGTPVTEIPVVTAFHGQTMLNLNTARTLGIEVPLNIIESMDIVIGETRAP